MNLKKWFIYFLISPTNYPIIFTKKIINGSYVLIIKNSIVSQSKIIIFYQTIKNYKIIFMELKFSQKWTSAAFII